MHHRAHTLRRLLPVLVAVLVASFGLLVPGLEAGARAATTRSVTASSAPSSPAAGRTDAESGVAEDQDFVIVRQRDKRYDPPVVVIHAGDAVVWVNESQGGWHDVQSYEGLFSSERMFEGDVFVQTFDEPGTYGYYCSPHVIDGMEGVVVVLPEGSPLPDPLSPPPAPASKSVTLQPPEPGRPDTIGTIAGSGGSGGAATDASLFLPEGVAVAPDGAVYVADTENCQIRRVDPGGEVVSPLGHESCGFSMGGDADLGPWQHTNHPRAVAVGPDGAVYVADTINCRIRRIQEGGTVRTFAGTGSCHGGGDGGPATEAGLSPWGLTWNREGNLFVADIYNCRIRQIDAQGIISTIAGNGSCGFSGDSGPATAAGLFFPRDVAAGPDGALFVADTGNCRVRRIDPTTGTIETVAGSGSCVYSGDGVAATESGLHPWAVAAGADGSLIVADRDNCGLRRFGVGGEIATVAGDEACGRSPALNRPGDVALADGGAIYVADTGNCLIKRTDAGGGMVTIAGNGVCAPGGDGGPAVSGGAWHPMGLAMGKNGDWFFSELDTCRVRRIDSSGAITTYAGNGLCGYTGDGEPATETRLGTMLGGMAVASDGTLFIADGYNCRVRAVAPDGIIATAAGSGTCGFSGDGGFALEASLGLVSDVALDGSDGLLIADPFNCRIRRLDITSGVIETVAGDGSCGYNGEDLPAETAGIEPWGVVAGTDGEFYVADSGNCRVRRIDSDRAISTLAGGEECGNSGDGGPATDAQLYRPYDLALDQAGNLYVADLRAFTVRKVDPQGEISTVAGVGISRPIDIGGYDPLNGHLCSVHALPVPVPSYLGDGGAATEAGLYFPYGIALDGEGHLYIADTFDHRVRRVTCGGDIPCEGPAVVAEPPDEQPRDEPGEPPVEPQSLPDTGRPRQPNGGLSLAGLLALAGAALFVRALLPRVAHR